MFDKIRSTLRILQTRETEKREEEKPLHGYEIVVKSAKGGGILFEGVVYDCEFRKNHCLSIAPKPGDELGKLEIALSGNELVFIQELANRPTGPITDITNRVNSFYYRERVLELGFAVLY